MAPQWVPREAELQLLQWQAAHECTLGGLAFLHCVSFSSFFQPAVLGSPPEGNTCTQACVSVFAFGKPTLRQILS